MFRNIPIDLLIPGTYQPRKVFHAESLEELAGSIKSIGVLQPLIVRKTHRADKRYEIVAGERRWRAAQLAGLQEVPCILNDREDISAASVALIENVVRVDLSVIEMAHAYKRLIDEFDLRQEDVANIVNKPRQSIANILRLLQLEPAIQEMIASNQLTEGHAKSLLSANKLQQLSLAKECFMHKWSVRKLETEIVKLKNIKSAHPQRKSEDPDTHFLERRLSEYLGSPVSIGKGKLEIEFLSTECLEGIFNKMGFKLEDD